MPGGAELFFIILVIIMLFGSKKIPELARGLGKGMREIKNATGDIQKEIRAGAKDINSMRDKMNVEKQVKDLMKEEKTAAESSQPTPDESKENTDPSSSKIHTSPNANTVKRSNAYEKESPQTPSENN